MSLEKKTRVESINFYTALLTFILLPLAYNGVDVDPTLTGGVVEDIFNKNYNALVVALPQLITIGMKLVGKIQAKAFSWEFLKSKNFITQALTTIIMVLVFFGIISAEMGATLSGLIHFLNTAVHFGKDGIKFREVKS